MLDYGKIIRENAEEYEGFRYPDWGALVRLVEKECDEERYDSVLTELARAWLLIMREHLGDEFELLESSHFLLLSREKEHVQKNLLYACENSRKIILEQFAGNLKKVGLGKHVLIVFHHAEDYYRYSHWFSGGGEAPMTGGMCINNGYTHIIIPVIEAETTPLSTIAHEFSHVMLSGYVLPNWLDEAIAMRMEDVVVEQEGLMLNEESYKQHIKYWDEKTIQGFWSGEVWGRESVGFSLSYQLARVLWQKIAIDLSATKEEVIELIETVQMEDCGNAAVKKIFDYSLGELVADFLGEGNWEPDEEQIQKGKELHRNFAIWDEEVRYLKSMKRDELLASNCSVLKPSEKLCQLWYLLDVVSVDDLVKISVQRLNRHHLLVEDNQYELYSKLGALELTIEHVDTLFNLSVLMHILRHGRIARGHLDGKNCVLIVEIDYLAGMIDSSFEHFTVTFEGFGGFEIIAWDGEIAGSKPLSMEEFINLKPVITGADFGVGRVMVSTDIGYGVDELKGADFSFYASGVCVEDPEGKEWSIEALQEIESEYWAGE